MWPFSRRPPDPTLRDVLLIVEQHRASTERKIKDLEMEWNDMFDRFRRLYAKIAKRAQDAESGAIEDPGVSEGRDPSDRPGNGTSEPFVGVLAYRSRLRGW